METGLENVSAEQQPDHRVIWHRDQPPLDLRTQYVSRILQVEGRKFSHPIHGDGVRWKLHHGEEPRPVIEFFSQRALLRLQIPLGEEFQTHPYPVERISIVPSDQGPSIMVTTPRLGRHITMVFISSVGGIDERHRWLESISDLSDSETNVRPNDRLTVSDVAEQLGYSEDWIRKLARSGLLPGEKPDGVWSFSPSDVNDIPSPLRVRRR